MPGPVLYTNRAIAANLKNKTKHCAFVLPGDNLSTNIRKGDVAVKRTDGLVIDVQSARAVQDNAGAWFLVVKTKTIPKRSYGESEEVSVTVTNPDTGMGSPDPLDPPVEVVYFEEETYRRSRTAPRLARRSTRAAAKDSRPVAKKARKAKRPTRKNKR
jgi:hypothetical protein